MKAYEEGKPMYFATPPVNLIHAFNASLKTITKGKISLEERFAMHKEQSSRIRKAIEELGLMQVAKNAGQQANGMTAVSVSEMASTKLLRYCRRFTTPRAWSLRMSCHDWVLRVSL